MQNALSIDLEEWYHPQLVQPHLGSTPRTSRVVEATEPLLTLLERHDVRATFFCVGEVVAQCPSLVRRIQDLGHEIAFHGMRHRPLWKLTSDDLESELDAFDRLVGQVLGKDVSIRGFRAPTFSLDHRTAWALPILAQRGYEYDSSVFPMRGPLYGVPGAPLSLYPVALDDPSSTDSKSLLIEVPPAVFDFGSIRLPIGGGVYLRLLPVSMVTRLLERINRKRPFVLYVHPWELDPQTPRVRLPAVTHFATYCGIRHTLVKLERILDTFQFTTVARVVDRWMSQQSSATEEVQC